MRMAKCVACVLVLMVGLPTAVGAQVASSFQRLRVTLHNGERIRVTDSAGDVFNGYLVALSDQSLQIGGSGTTKDFSEGDVAKIERAASRTKKGAAAGLVTGAITGALAVVLSPPCEGFCPGPGKGVGSLALGGIFGGIGAAVGAEIGRHQTSYTPVYLAPGRMAGTP